MTDVARAFQILGVEGDATAEGVEEAYQDLKAVWDPDRFADNPELYEKAERKLAQIEQAYQFLIEHLAQEQTREESTFSDREEGGGRGPSILDDTLSERMVKRRSLLPVWLGLFGLVAVAAIISFWNWSPVDTDVEEKRSILDTAGVAVDPGSVSGQEDEPAGVQNPETEAVEEEAESDRADLKSPATVTTSEIPRASEEAPPPAVTPVVEKPQPSDSSGQRTKDQADTQRTAVETRREEAPKEAEPPAEEPEDEPTEEPEEPAVSEIAERAFQILRAKSELADRLIEGGIAGVNYQTWTAVERDSTEVYVDLVAEREGREVHFVWSVNVESQAVKAMSHAARTLKADER